MKTRASIVFDPPASGSLDVKVFGPDGELIRIIAGAFLLQRPKRDQRETPKTAPRTVAPLVAMVKARRREERP